MKQLTRAPVNAAYIDDFVRIRDSKKLAIRTPLAAKHNKIAAQYTQFETRIDNGDLENFAADNACAALTEELRACYGGETAALSALKRLIRETQALGVRPHCPMCGTTLHSTHDHYAPAVKFPELSVHPLNLVPCCATCNSTKNNDWLDASGERQYLHAYSDEIPESQFVEVDLHEDVNFQVVGATFRLVRPVGISHARWRLLKNHFKRLRLLARYDDLGGNEIASHLRSCLAYVEAGGERPRVFLAAMAKNEAVNRGMNHWRAVLMHGLAAHQHFHRWLTTAWTQHLFDKEVA